MMAETFIVQEVKESCCFVAAADGGKRGLQNLLGGGRNVDALDFRECMERCRATHPAISLFPYSAWPPVSSVGSRVMDVDADFNTAAASASARLLTQAAKSLTRASNQIASCRVGFELEFEFGSGFLLQFLFSFRLTSLFTVCYVIFADPSPQTNPIVQEYTLPDLAVGRKGHVRIRTNGQQPSNERDRRREEQVLVMGVERFSVPEVLFRPDDIGLNQSGLAPTIAHSLASLPAALQPFAGMFWAHVGLVGGCTKFPGFRERLQAELRALAPVGCDVRVWGGAQDKTDPITTAYRAACSFASSSSSSQLTAASSYPSFAQQTLSRAEYLETGAGGAATRRRFGAADWMGAAEENWRARVDEAFGAFEDDDEIQDLENMDVDKEGGGERGIHTRYSSSARTREDERLEDEDEDDAETKAAREKEERRKAARRKRDAERKKRLAEEAAAAGDGNASTSVHGATGSTVTVSKARGGARGKQKDRETETASAAGDGKGKGKAKPPTPAPAAPPRLRVRSTRAGAAEMEEVQEQVPAHATEGNAAGGATADADAEVQMG
ncbi:hypothetical protein D9619_012664 [Psilocybe cf. subviscida]|uniref:Uncharacterized protein n=1 Tax=Psilocybe cf. subviscida TaxID=2480587 RepID=A0A8H5EZ78_9AGAR|nr:hypothetical protein D9619_012664 [Psilocybe cf. subviscida]